MRESLWRKELTILNGSGTVELFDIGGSEPEDPLSKRSERRLERRPESHHTTSPNDEGKRGPVGSDPSLKQDTPEVIHPETKWIEGELNEEGEIEILDQHKDDDYLSTNFGDNYAVYDPKTDELLYFESSEQEVILDKRNDIDER